MATHGKIEELTEGTDLIEYSERLEYYFIANGVTDAEKKKAILLTVCGASTYSLLSNLCAPDKPKDKNYKDIIQLLKTHFYPKPLVIVERFKFWQVRQAANQNVRDFVSTLKKYSQYCEFGRFLDEALRDIFVIGLKSAVIQKKLLSKDGLAFQAAIEIAVAMEEAEKQAQEISKSMSSDVNKLQLDMETKSCFRCGKNNHPPEQCYFRDSECFKCKRKGHISRQCKINPSVSTVGNQNLKFKKKSSKIRYVGENIESGSDSDDTATPKQVWPVMSLKYKDKPIVVKVKINGKVLEMELDTGASLTIISEEVYRRNFSEIALNPCDKLLRTYTGQNLKVMGELRVQVGYGKQIKQLEMIVVHGGGPSLFGRNWLQEISLDWKEINLVYFHSSVDARLIDTLSKVKVFNDELGTVKGITGTLKIKSGAKPKFYKPRSVPYALKDKIGEELDRLEQLGVLEKIAYSEWAAPIVPVLKPNGAVRICGDYKVTINPSLEVTEHPLPSASDIFANLNGGQKFTKLDLSNAYQQVTLEESSRNLVTINTQRGLYRYTRIPYGVASAPADFQKIMEKILEGLEGVQCILDDLIITGENEEQHLLNVINTLKRLDAYGIRLNKSKCVFMEESVIYFGFQIDKTGVRPTSDKVKAVLKMREPTNKEELQSALGIINYYRRFIPNMSTLVAPLNNLLKRGVNWEWTKQCEEVYKQLKQMLVSSEVLVHYSPDKSLILEVDASPVGLGAVISHEFNGTTQPIAYASRTLNAAERNYSQIEREALAIIFGLRKFHQYLYGRKFILYTDHKPLTFILGEKAGIPTLATSRLQRWAIQLSAYNYDIRYRNTKLNQNADTLSRLPIEESLDVNDDSLFWCEEAARVNQIQLENLPITAKKIALATRNDIILQRVSHFIATGWPERKDVLDSELLPYFNHRVELTIEEGCILRGIRVVIPSILQKDILCELHSNHPGIVRMKALARLHIWWPNIDSAIEVMVSNCTNCKLKSVNAPSSPVNPWIWPTKPWSRIHIDYAGPFLGEMFLVVVDAHSKWPEVVRVSSATTETTINALRFLFSSHGIPEVLVSDNGSQFTSLEFECFLKNNGVKHILSAPYNPQSNGQAEAGVKSFKQTLKCRLKEPGSLNLKLASLLLSYRTTPHSTTKRTPAELFLGRRIRSRLDLLKPSLENRIMKNASSKVTAPRGVEIGDVVLVRDYRKNGEFWVKGVVLYKLGPVTYHVQVGDLRWKRHIDQIKPCLHPNTVGKQYFPEQLELEEHELPVAAEIQSPEIASTVEKDTVNTEVVTNTDKSYTTSQQSELMEQLPTTQRRSTRNCTKPVYLKDFVTKFN